MLSREKIKKIIIPYNKNICLTLNREIGSLFLNTHHFLRVNILLSYCLILKLLIMNSKQESKLKMYLVVRDFVNLYLLIANALPNFSEFFAAFVSSITQIQTHG